MVAFAPQRPVDREALVVPDKSPALARLGKALHLLNEQGTTGNADERAEAVLTVAQHAPTATAVNALSGVVYRWGQGGEPTQVLTTATATLGQMRQPDAVQEVWRILQDPELKPANGKWLLSSEMAARCVVGDEVASDMGRAILARQGGDANSVSAAFLAHLGKGIAKTGFNNAAADARDLLHRALRGDHHYTGPHNEDVHVQLSDSVRLTALSALDSFLKTQPEVRAWLIAEVNNPKNSDPIRSCALRTLAETCPHVPEVKELVAGLANQTENANHPLHRQARLIGKEISFSC